MSLLGSLQDLFSKKPAPTKTLGTGGTAVWGGYVESGEKNPKLVGVERYGTYSTLLANTSIVAASVRYFLSLVAKAGWKAEPADDSAKAKEIAEWFEEAMANCTTPWHRIVRRAALYRYYGFSIAEWTAKRNDDGTIGILDIESRPQHTIEQWGVDESGTVVGVVQRSPQTFKDINLPRSKLLYVVDDSITDSPEGQGLFRHVVEAIERLREYERLEGIGFEMDLRGIPVGRAPITSLQQMVKTGQLSEAQMQSQLTAMRTFLQNHKKTASLAMLLDSRVYESTGDTRNPSGQKQWDIDVIKAGQTSAPELAAAIQRINREVARVLGTENILLGESGAGSLAMARDKSDQFALIVDATLKEIAEVIQSDIVKRFMKLNGWDEKLAPRLTPDKIQFRSVEEITAALRDMALAGASMAPDDPAINDLRAMLGLTEVDLDQMAIDAALMRETELAAMQAKTFGPDGKPVKPNLTPSGKPATGEKQPGPQENASKTKASVTAKAYDPDQPRSPAGVEGGRGGQWRGGASGSGGGSSSVAQIKASPEYKATTNNKAIAERAKNSRQKFLDETEGDPSRPDHPRHTRYLQFDNAFEGSLARYKASRQTLIEKYGLGTHLDGLDDIKKSTNDTNNEEQE